MIQCLFCAQVLTCRFPWAQKWFRSLCSVGRSWPGSLSFSKSSFPMADLVFVLFGSPVIVTAPMASKFKPRSGTLVQTGLSYQDSWLHPLPPAGLHNLVLRTSQHVGCLESALASKGRGPKILFGHPTIKMVSWPTTFKASDCWWFLKLPASCKILKWVQGSELAGINISSAATLPMLELLESEQWTELRILQLCLHMFEYA